MQQRLPDKRIVKVQGLNMAYCDVPAGQSGDGPTVVFLHGNPTSSYLWRNIIPHVTPVARCLAPDLIGMGDSEKLPGTDADRYAFATHRQFLSEFLATILDRDASVVLVLHDWGSALGFDWAKQHAERVAGLVYMEGFVRSLVWDEWPQEIRSLFQALRSETGEKLILEKNVFLENILPGSILRQLTEAEMNAYRQPFLAPGEDRRPMLSWPRALPLDGEPAEVVDLIDQYADWMATNQIPKLFINAEPGAVLVGAQRETCRRWQNQIEITVPGIHFIQEDSPTEIGQACAAFVQGLKTG